MYFASKNSKNRIVHYDHCGYRKRMQKENIIVFKTLEAAREAGYRLCDCCAPIHKYIKAEADEIYKFSLEYGIACFQHDGAFCIRTPMSNWKIIVNGQKHNIFLYHKNTSKVETPSMVKGYHSQCVRSDTILGYLNYIAEHDKFRKQHPLIVTTKKEPPRKGTKRWRKEEKRKKRSKRRQEIRRVYELIEAL